MVAIILIINCFRSPQSAITKKERYHGIVQRSSTNDTGQHLTVKTTLSGGKRATVLLTYPTVRIPVAPGDSVSFSSTLNLPNPPDMHENDYASTLRRSGIEYTSFVRPDSLTVTGRNNSLYWRIRRLQPLISEILKRSDLDTPACEFLIATLTGDSSILPEATRTRFSSSGVAHVLALSGLHVGIIAIVLSILLFPLRITGKRHLPTAVTIIALWSYAVMTGLSPSVTRAVIMASTIGIGFMLKRRYSSFNALLLAMIIILIFDPIALFQPGFQLSFSAVASILIFSIPLYNAKIKNRTSYYIVSLFTVTVAATLGTSMTAAYHFHTFPCYFILANIPVIILLPFILSGGIIILLFEATGIGCGAVCQCVDFLYSIIDDITSTVEMLPGATLKGIYFSGWTLIPYFATLTAIALAIFYRQRIWYFLSPLFLIMTVVMLLTTAPRHPEEEFFITRSTYETSAIYRHANEAFLITTAAPQNASSVIYAHQRRFGDYLSSRGIDSLRIAPDTFAFMNIKRIDNTLIYKSRSYRFIYTDILEPTDTVDYAVVCRGFKGDILDIVRVMSPDTVLLSNDLHPRRHDRYLDSLRRYNIPHRSLKKYKNTK